MKVHDDGCLTLIFEGAKWSERIWKRQEQLRKLVKTEVTRALIRGENGITIAQRIRKYMDVSRTDAERLAITEHARVQTLAQQDIMKDIYMDSFKGKILDDITRYQVVEKGIIDDNKLEPIVQAEDMKVIVSKFEDIQEIFQNEYSATQIGDGIRTETQELLTIDGIESVYVVFIKIPLQIFVSTNGWDIDIVASKKNTMSYC